MNVELPPFKNGEHNFESASTLERDITPLSKRRATGTWRAEFIKQVFPKLFRPQRPLAQVDASR